MPYRAANTVFNWLYRVFNGVHLSKAAPPVPGTQQERHQFHPAPSAVGPQLPSPACHRRFCARQPGLQRPAASGAQARPGRQHRPGHAPAGLDHARRCGWSRRCRCSALGANLLYSVYVVAVGLLRSDVAPGWISLSLQQSGMFFLISLVLLVLGEYILNMASLSNEGPPYHVGQELTSVRVTRREKLNVEEAAPDMVPDTVR
ncbi:hypothetical protein LP419_26605 [Massilia sp. H-1]|nr:hypothetical protein LP419_26605 [Massilia sp. H-1]